MGNTTASYLSLAGAFSSVESVCASSGWVKGEQEREAGERGRIEIGTVGESVQTYRSRHLVGPVLGRRRWYLSPVEVSAACWLCD